MPETETLTAHCKSCKTTTEHYRYDGINWAEIVTVCDVCGHETRDAIMTPAEILAEGRRGY